MKSFSSKKRKTGKNRRGRLLMIWVVFFLCLAAAAVWGYEKFYEQKIYPRVTVGDIDLTGRSREETLDLLKQFSQKIEREGMIFTAQNKEGESKEAKIGTALIGLSDPDLSKTILTFQAEETVSQAWQIGRPPGNLLEKLKSQWRAFYGGQKINFQFQLDEAEFEKILRNEFADLEEPAVDAKLSFNGEHEMDVRPEKWGYGFDYQKAVAEVKKNLGNLSDQPVGLAVIDASPKIFKVEAAKLIPEINAIRGTAPVSLSYDSRKKTISRDQMEEWLEFQFANSVQINGELNTNNTKVALGLNKDKVTDFLQAAAKEVDVEPVDAKFIMAEGKVTEFRPSQDGLKLDLDENCQILNREIIANRSGNIRLKVKTVQPKIDMQDINEYGIRELIGSGKSNFAGSPKNRRLNIKTGADKLNGVLIKPDEEFSVIKTLGEINKESGYLPELVIKRDKTVPEYGGGLCQIGTTAFRVALNAGLPIAERQAHTYRVVYYEPAGMDATIYNPSPDLKFVNDTGSHILFLTKIKGDELIFEFWGTADGRKVEVTEPEIYNIVKSGPPRYVETEDLKPGEKKKIESAHNGADAKFTRKVTYSDGTVKEKVWKSHYVPWQEVWLVGKEKGDEAVD